ncbi:hypothetical protein KCG48_05385 [Proteiniclasticum sp. BAD-10]|uniref:Uncharacterized protein n=1 Tax=Proteiniclasticum sediminis TaxID=2804028 RepID=A0A941HR24_9CLOT|nr:hypothetical protein [Proteiniclasticum sediminis]MBR0575772.1 hypothetical protein [Proteiniclasticum sediminis]
MNFRQEDAPIYKKGIPLVRVLFILFLALSLFLSDSAYAPLLDGLRYGTLILWTLLEGTRDVFAKKKATGWITYALGALLLVVFLIFR